MTCKEKIDEIEKILDDEYEVKIGRIRRIVEDAEDKAIPLDKVKQARAKIKTYKHGNGNMYTCGLNKAVEILDKLIESEEL